MAARAVSRLQGPEAARAFEQEQYAQLRAADDTRRKQEEARQLSAHRVALGAGQDHIDEFNADTGELVDQSKRDAAKRAERDNETNGERIERQVRDRRGKGSRARARRTIAKTARTLKKQFRAIVGERYTREEEDADRMAARALERHGIRHHYRPICKVAWFSAYRAGLDRNGVAALRALQSIGMPLARQAAACEAAYQPLAWTPRREVCTGKRAGQRRYKHDGRTFGGKQWADGMRHEAHPGAIAVLQCAIFLWLSRYATTRPGFAYVVRGFGRGVFEALTEMGKSSLVDHTNGLPGALLALRLAGFVTYNQPPAEVARSARDLGPTGHAYTVYWFASTPEERELDAYFERVAKLARMPLIERLAHDPDQLGDATAALFAVERAPPGVIDPASVPF